MGETAYLFYFQPQDGEKHGRFVLVDKSNDHSDFGQFLEEISAESERGVAVLSAAILDDLLREMIIAHLQNSSEAAEIFGPSRALGTLGARADISFALGIISHEERTNIRKIQKIRNEFAHIRATDFARQDISDRCKQLDYAELPSGVAGMSTRDVFLAHCLNLAWEFYGRPGELKKLQRPIRIHRSVTSVKIGKQKRKKKSGGKGV